MGQPIAVSPVDALARWPEDMSALAWPGGAWTGGELRERIDRLAALAARLGCAGGALAIASRSRRLAALGALVALRLGRPPLILDPERRDFQSLLAAVPVGAAIADPDLELPGSLSRVDISDSVTGLARVASGSPTSASPPSTGGATVLVPTSGTMGAARVAQLTGRALDAHVAASALVLPPLTRGGRWLVCLPMTTIGALAALWRSLAAGACFALLERFDAETAHQMLVSGVTHASIVPAMLEPLVRVGPPPTTLRCLLCGGGPLGSEAAALARAKGWPLWTGWGMTETASHVAVGPVDAQWREGIVGRPLPGVEIEVDVESGRLVVGGPMLMAGYAAGGEGLRADGRFLTSDLGELLPDGRVCVRGRADDVIVTAGVNVHPQAVEDVLAACPGVDAVAVTARPDPRWGQVLIALYEGMTDGATLDRWARSQLDAALRPRHYRRVAALPRNAMGKLLRGELPSLLERETADE